MRRSLRPWWLALGVSLLLHGVLVSGLWWSLPQWAPPLESMQFEARLVSAAPPTVPAQPAKPSAPPALPAPSEKPPAPPVPQPSAPPPASVQVAPPEQTAAAVVDPELIAVPTRIAPPVKAAPDPAIPREHPAAEVDAPLLNPLPQRVDMRFKLHYGLASGEQTLVWVNEGSQRYTVISVAEATGLAGLFYRGKFVQTSRGRITSRGLQPEEFWDQRGDKRSSAQFDVDQGHLTLSPAKGGPQHFTYQVDVQDVLSLFFQLALTAPPSEAQLAYTVFNGKKLRDYRYVVRGEVMLETAVGSLRALHLARVADSDGRFEIWLAIDRHYLPVRVLKSDDKGNEIELSVLSIAP